MGLADDYPDGRTFYYEGDDPDAFLDSMDAAGLSTEISVYVPADRLDEFMARGWGEQGWDLGT